MVQNKQRSFLGFYFTLVLFLVSLFLSNPTLAVTLDTIKANYENVHSWTGQFVQVTVVTSLKQRLVKNGFFTVKRPEHLKINYQTAPQKNYLLRPDGLWTWIENEKEISYAKEASKTIDLSILSVLNDFNQLYKNYRPIPKATADLSAQQGKSLTYFSFIPQDTNSTLVELVIGADKDNLVKEILFLNRDGNISIYRISQLVLNPTLPQETFAIPENMKVINAEDVF